MIDTDRAKEMAAELGSHYTLEESEEYNPGCDAVDFNIAMNLVRSRCDLPISDKIVSIFAFFIAKDINLYI